MMGWTTSGTARMEPIRVRRRAVAGQPGAHLIEASMRIPVALAEVFAFFSDAGNLGRITPPELRFRILSPQPIHLSEGARIDYQIRLFGVPLRWRSGIAVWDPPRRFVDEQLRGPYREWVHEHRFFSEPDGCTRIEDVVRFQLPFGLLGELGWPVVAAQLRRIFRYRQERIRDLLSA